MIAVKQIELKTKRAEETARAVEQEIRMMEGLRHSNIVRLLGFSVVERTMNVIMEFVAGNSLDDVLQTMGPLHESLIRRYVRQILLGQYTAATRTLRQSCIRWLVSHVFVLLLLAAWWCCSDGVLTQCRPIPLLVCVDK